MARDTPTKEYDIKLSANLDWYGESEYPRFSICVNYWEEEILEDEHIKIFYPDNKEELIDYINTDIQEDLNNYDDIESVEIYWEKDCCDLELVDRIYEKN